MTDDPLSSSRIYIYDSGHGQFIDVPVIVEKAVGLTVNGEFWLTFLCTPSNLDALAVGFLFNEGLVENLSEIENIYVCENYENIDVWLTHTINKPVDWQKTSGCSGGVTTANSPPLPPLNINNRRIKPEIIDELLEWLHQGQSLYQKSGGVHTSILSDGSSIIYTMEDIGRHNTLDKISGRCLLEENFPQFSILITTGRISSEMLRKARRINAYYVISKTSPTNLSVELANEYGITLIGYARRKQFRIYTHPDRIIP